MRNYLKRYSFEPEWVEKPWDEWPEEYKKPITEWTDKMLQTVSLEHVPVDKQLPPELYPSDEEVDEFLDSYKNLGEEIGKSTIESVPEGKKRNYLKAHIKEYFDWELYNTMDAPIEKWFKINGIEDDE